MDAKHLSPFDQMKQNSIFDDITESCLGHLALQIRTFLWDWDARGNFYRGAAHLSELVEFNSS